MRIVKAFLQLTPYRNQGTLWDILYYEDRQDLMTERFSAMHLNFPHSAWATVGALLTGVEFNRVRETSLNPNEAIEGNDCRDPLPKELRPKISSLPAYLTYTWLKNFKEGDPIILRPSENLQIELICAGRGGLTFEQHLAKKVAHLKPKDYDKTTIVTEAAYLGFLHLRTDQLPHRLPDQRDLTCVEKSFIADHKKAIDFYRLPNDWELTSEDIVVPVMFGFDERDDSGDWGDGGGDDFLPDYTRDDVPYVPPFPSHLPLRVIKQMKEGDFLIGGLDNLRRGSAFIARNLDTHHYANRGDFQTALAYMLEAME